MNRFNRYGNCRLNRRLLFQLQIRFARNLRSFFRVVILLYSCAGSREQRQKKRYGKKERAYSRGFTGARSSFRARDLVS